jgi:hypothetical protein
LRIRLTLLAGEHELSTVHALRRAHQSVDSLEVVGVLELDLGNGSASARVVHDVLHNTLDVAVSLGVVILLHGHRALASSGVSPEHGSLSLSLRANDLTHFISEERLCMQGKVGGHSAEAVFLRMATKTT